MRTTGKGCGGGSGRGEMARMARVWRRVGGTVSGPPQTDRPGAYCAKPSRGVRIGIDDGRQRPLGIAALEDKVVQPAAEVGDIASGHRGKCGASVARAAGRPICQSAGPRAYPLLPCPTKVCALQAERCKGLHLRTDGSPVGGGAWSSLADGPSSSVKSGFRASAQT
jgi:hypothetical protein